MALGSWTLGQNVYRNKVWDGKYKNFLWNWTQILDNRRASTLCVMDLESWINLILIGDIFLATTNWKPQNYSSTNKYEHKLKTNVTFKIISLWIKHQTKTYFQVKPNLKTKTLFDTFQTGSVYRIGVIVHFRSASGATDSLKDSLKGFLTQVLGGHFDTFWCEFFGKIKMKLKSIKT